MSAPPFKVKAVHDYSSPHEDDLNFSTGQIITVTEEEDAEWYVGEYITDDGTKKDGLFPRNFVERYEPQAPPRPTRSRPKQEPQPSTEPAAGSVKEELIEPKAIAAEAEEAAPQVQTPPSQEKLPPAPKPQPVKPVPLPGSKPSAPETGAKPSSSSFKDRIAAFNKPAAPPIAPKPSAASGGPSFIKKPFVAPPPARNAYVPPPRAEAPQKAYRREEDPEIAERRLQDQKDAEEAGLVTNAEHDESEEVPKATSLKDRIALLQKQQQEQAARRAETAAKDKPKKSAKPKPEASAAAGDEEAEGRPDLATPEEQPRMSSDLPRPVPGRLPSHDSEMDDGPREAMSDGNEADQSGAGETTEDAGGDSTEVEEMAERAKPRATMPPPRSSTGDTHKSVSKIDEGEPEGNGQEGQEDEEEKEDPETKRKEELRARMAKMSGGMGMPGMFGMPPPKPPAKKASGSSEHRSASQEARSPPPTQRVPMMPMAGVPARVQSPPTLGDTTPHVEKEPEPGMPISDDNPAEAVPDVEDLGSQSHGASHPQEHSRTRQMSQDRPLPPLPPSQQRSAAPPIPGDRPVPKRESRPVPPPPPRVPAANGEDEESAEEISKNLSQRQTEFQDGKPIPHGPPPIPGLQSNLPHRDSPTTPSTAEKRMSEIPSSPPSVPTASPPGIGQRSTRAPPPSLGSPQMPPSSALDRIPPPPPPPSAVPQSRHSTGRDSLGPPARPADDHESEYEGDYDTDIAPTASHKDALKARLGRESSLDDEGTLSESTAARSPVIAPPPPPFTSRAPPPPPQQAPPSRKSTDVPRAPAPVPPSHQENDDDDDDDDDYDPYRYDAPGPPSTSTRKARVPAEHIQESDPDLYTIPSQEVQQRAPPPVPASGPPPQKYSVPPPPPEPRNERDSSEIPRRSLDHPRQSMAGRRSMDPGSRPMGDDNGYIARDLDLAESTQWWAQTGTPPPSLQNRSDVLYEMEESTTSKRGGRSTTSKDLYVLFQDYSQTIITIRYDTKDPSRDVHLEQRHEPPPNKMRQDQLEAAYNKFGEPIAAAAMTKQSQTVGDGTPRALVLEILDNAAPGALQPVGTRAYGALVYANMGNASVSQLDEIRPGDIVSFRNAKFKGKHGAMHAKYSMDVGKPEHVAIVMEWDGTKKKIRALEQGREKEGKKVRMESFRVGDLGAGEVKVWRVVGREWVGWEGNT